MLIETKLRTTLADHLYGLGKAKTGTTRSHTPNLSQHLPLPSRETQDWTDSGLWKKRAATVIAHDAWSCNREGTSQKKNNIDDDATADLGQ